MEFEDILKTQTCDWHHDISLHLGTKTEILRNITAKSNYYTTLSQDFVVHDDHNPSSDQDFVKFMDGFYGVVRCQLLSFQENNAEENETDEDHVDPQYKIFLENFRAHAKSYVLDYREDSVFVNYEADCDDGSKSNSKSPTDCAAANDNDDRNPVYFDSAESSHDCFEKKVGSEGEKQHLTETKTYTH